MKKDELDKARKAIADAPLRVSTISMPRSVWDGPDQEAGPEDFRRIRGAPADLVILDDVQDFSDIHARTAARVHDPVVECSSELGPCPACERQKKPKVLFVGHTWSALEVQVARALQNEGYEILPFREYGREEIEAVAEKRLQSNLVKMGRRTGRSEATLRTLADMYMEEKDSLPPPSVHSVPKNRKERRRLMAEERRLRRKGR